MPTIRVALQIHPQQWDYPDMRRAWQRGEELGVDIIYNWDHFYPLYGDADGPHFECLTVLAAMAEVTERVEFGPLVICNSYRNPNLVADMARTIDHISGGRFILGMGAGWFRRDYEEYGYEFATAGRRLDALAEAMTVIERRLSALNPPPVRDIPVLIGGGGERKTLRITAQHADIWHGFGEPDVLRHKNAVLDRWCAEVGRDPSLIERSGGIPQDKLHLADEMLDAGITQFTLGGDRNRLDFGAVREMLAWRDERNRQLVS